MSYQYLVVRIKTTTEYKTFMLNPNNASSNNM